MAKITISEIARRAGVSKTAVSFAFNDPARLPETTVQRIRAVAEELGYMPNPVARSLSNKRTGNLGLLFPQPLPDVLSNPYMLDLLRGVGKACDAEGYNMMLVSPILGSMHHAVSGAVVDGFLTIGLEHYKSTITLLERREIPYVMVDSEPFEGASCVNVDDEAGAYAAMRHVLDHGHRRIAIFGIESGKHGHFETYVGTIHRRMVGYRRALAEFGLDVDGRQVELVECVCTYEGGYDKLAALWEGEARPTAVVCMADIIAAGVLDAAASRGVQVPHALSVIGYDDLPLSRWTNPPLTTVFQPSEEKGQYAAGLLLQILQGNVTLEHHVFPTRLIERESVATASALTGRTF